MLNWFFNLHPKSLQKRLSLSIYYYITCKRVISTFALLYFLLYRIIKFSSPFILPNSYSCQKHLFCKFYVTLKITIGIFFTLHGGEIEGTEIEQVCNMYLLMCFLSRYFNSTKWREVPSNERSVVVTKIIPPLSDIFFVSKMNNNYVSEKPQ